ncbi:MAG: sel1 repeat family protein [Robiginitomaculum sp.]|nr:sel1 repeat family protein [Robiginitomaculum sp.]
MIENTKITLVKNILIVCVLCLACLVLPVDTANAQTASSTEELKLAGGTEARAVFIQAKKFHDGDGVKQDFSKARLLYLKAAGMGSNDARVNLGYLYSMGEGVAQNYTKARNWYLSAANNGDKAAQENLAMMYELGLGVEKDAAKAKYWREFGSVKPAVSYSMKSTLKAENTTEQTPEIVANLPPKPTIISMQEPIIIAPIAPTVDIEKNEFQHLKLTPEIKSNPNNRVPVMASNMLAGFMFALATMTGVWFVVQYSRLQAQKTAQIFAKEFYTHYRDQLRIHYLRYPVRNRKHGDIEDMWAGALCTLMVRFAQEKQEDTDILGEQSRKIVKALSLSAINARQAVFPFVERIQQQIYADILAHDCKPQNVTQDFLNKIQLRIKAKTTPTNVVKLHEKAGINI